MDDTKAKMEELKENLKIVTVELQLSKTRLDEKDVEINNVSNSLKQEQMAREELKKIMENDAEMYRKRCSELETIKETLVQELETVNKVDVESKYRVLPRERFIFVSYQEFFRVYRGNSFENRTRKIDPDERPKSRSRRVSKVIDGEEHVGGAIGSVGERVFGQRSLSILVGCEYGIVAGEFARFSGRYRLRE